MLGPLLEVEMSKKCTPLWREAHIEVKMYKTPLSGAEGGRANDLTLVIYFHKENAVSRNQDMENDHNKMEKNSFQNI